MKKRVVVAMSGGVDSSVAAALLKEQGYEVIGLTLCFSLPEAEKRRPACCNPQAIEDAGRVACQLGIRHYSIPAQKVLREHVIADFLGEYALGRTPNPCVRCNQYIKFGFLLKRALALGAEFLASGHYARVTKTREGFRLKKGRDGHKDQSYFLYRLNQGQLRYTLFPLGNFTKEEVRCLARKIRLPVAEKTASQEICFFPGDDYRTFLQGHIGGKIQPGPVVDAEGHILGQHKGIPYYTIGQREGLGIAGGVPLYITRIDAKNHKITVGKKEEACKREFLIKQPHFILKPIKKRVAVKVRIRYNHKEARAEIYPSGNKIKVRFLKPQFAVTPGQSAVFYDEDNVLGGGIIDKILS